MAPTEEQDDDYIADIFRELETLSELGEESGEQHPDLTDQVIDFVGRSRRLVTDDGVPNSSTAVRDWHEMYNNLRASLIGCLANGPNAHRDFDSRDGVTPEEHMTIGMDSPFDQRLPLTSALYTLPSLFDFTVKFLQDRFTTAMVSECDRSGLRKSSLSIAHDLDYVTRRFDTHCSQLSCNTGLIVATQGLVPDSSPPPLDEDETVRFLQQSHFAVQKRISMMTAELDKDLNFTPSGEFIRKTLLNLSCLGRNALDFASIPLSEYREGPDIYMDRSEYDTMVGEYDQAQGSSASGGGPIQ